MNEGPRNLLDYERELLAKLLSADFPGREELQQQADTAKVSKMLSQGSPALLFSVDKSKPSANVRQRVPVEGTMLSPEGKTIHCLLHVVDGYLDELEFFREDGSPISKIPRARDLQVSIN